MTSRRAFLRAATGGAVVGACAGPAPAPSLEALDGSRQLVLGPTAEFDPARPPEGWSLVRPEAGAGFATVAIAGRPALRIDAPAGATLARATDARLLATPFISWAWSLETPLYGGGPGDGLQRGLRLVVGFRGGARSDILSPEGWFRSDRGFPAHDRRLEIALGGVGAARPEFASIELAAVPEAGQRRLLRGPVPAPTQTGGWHQETADLAALYRGFWPGDRAVDAAIAFVGIGGLPARLPDGVPPTIGHVVEIQLTR